MQKVLILTTSFGGGHKSVAAALKRDLEENHNLEVKIIDLYEVSIPRLNLITAKGYVYMMKYTPKVYGLFYNQTKDLEKSNPFNMLFTRPSLGALRDLIEREKPDGLVAVYPTYAGMFYHLKKAGFSLPKSFVVITDFVAHIQWLYDDIDVYFVPSFEVKLFLLKKGIKGGRIEVSGIPIQREFDLKKSSKRDLILISAGLFGMTPSISEICKAVEEVVPNGFEILLLCGLDESLSKKAQSIFRRVKTIEGFLSYDQIAGLMGQSYVLISKAGGLTTSEALASETPMIIYKPLPGQEYYNALYLEKNEAGLVANSKEELKRLLTALFKERDLYEKLLENIRRIKKPNSASHVAKVIHDELQRRN
ncbi:MAG: hypothetical protein N2Z40_04470 [Caldimicrobium sp.]|nr:hypothetical protein [Caldimicrobium sp.]MCX7613459.1 hypothetical protein [Caldimicrobium sp.]MDW8182969.1 glycosyltransferase [Caldimicrobium sp.]